MSCSSCIEEIASPICRRPATRPLLTANQPGSVASPELLKRLNLTGEACAEAPGLYGRADSRLPAMDLTDATLMILAESAAHPRLAVLARSAHDQLIMGGDVDYHVLSDIIAEASGKGVLRVIRQKHGAIAHEAIFGPILREIDRQKPVPPRSSPSDRQNGPDPLTAASW